MSVVIGIACEDNGHFTAVTRLVDDALIASHNWLEGIIADCRTWRGLEDGELWYKYDSRDANDLRPIMIDGQRIAPQGLIRGEPLKAEAGMWRKILLLFCHSNPQPKVVILARDMDGYPERLAGILQVCDRLPWPFKIAVAAPEPEIEAWYVAGFTPNGEKEHERLDALRRKLSFDPTTQSHRLTSHPNDARTDAKRVLEHLCDGDRERRDACLADPTTLRKRSAANGLDAFLNDVDGYIVPLFGGPQ